MPADGYLVDPTKQGDLMDGQEFTHHVAPIVAVEHTIANRRYKKARLAAAGVRCQML